ncbi:hypothetical protein [Cognataquiflexum rubidum]|uniref:hypothetical protein n=1 Tax=Cognataquiflexum rubidum TaxID=2922273 RepID=UPI001F13423A|nr:hypothetical protein [Cognataquiflexum rubidum]MCH6235146.1 hypothetical protein [Cognataquiflexum rubidum]
MNVTLNVVKSLNCKEILGYTTNDVNLLVVTLSEAKGLFFLRSFILVPRIQDDARPTVIPFLNIF